MLYTRHRSTLSVDDEQYVNYSVYQQEDFKDGLTLSELSVNKCLPIIFIAYYMI